MCNEPPNNTKRRASWYVRCQTTSMIRCHWSRCFQRRPSLCLAGNGAAVTENSRVSTYYACNSRFSESRFMFLNETGEPQWTDSFMAQVVPLPEKEGRDCIVNLYWIRNILSFPRRCSLKGLCSGRNTWCIHGKWWKEHNALKRYLVGIENGTWHLK